MIMISKRHRNRTRFKMTYQGRWLAINPADDALLIDLADGTIGTGQIDKGMAGIFEEHRGDIHEPVLDGFHLRFHFRDDQHGTGAYGGRTTQKDGANKHC